MTNSIQTTSHFCFRFYRFNRLVFNTQFIICLSSFSLIASYPFRYFILTLLVLLFRFFNNLNLVLE